MVNYEKLIEAGVDVEDLLRRLMGNTMLVKVLTNKFIADTTYEQLVSACAAQDWKKAEFASHTLKGMCGNMGLTDLFADFTEQVQLFRTGEYEKAEAMMSKISENYEKAILLMKAWVLS